MIDLVEIRNIDGDKINVRLDANKANLDNLGELFAHIRIGDAPYLLVADKPDEDEPVDSEGRTWRLVAGPPKCLPDEFFENENTGWIIQMIAPFLGEEKLKKIQAVLEEQKDV